MEFLVQDPYDDTPFFVVLLMRDSGGFFGGPVRFKVFTLAIACTLLATFAHAVTQAEYQLHKKITLGKEGGWDYFDVDPESGHVFIPRDSHILVADSEGNQVADILGVKGAHAIVFAPDLKKAFLSTDGSVSVLDMATMNISGEISLSGKDPDAVLYDSSLKRVFTFNGGGSQDATVIDAATAKVLGSIPLGGKPETAQADGEGRVYVNIEDKNRIAVIDSKALKVLATWPVAPCEDPAGMAIDVIHKRLFVGCRNRLMAVVDYTSGKVVGTVPIGSGVDANRFDPQTGLAFASCGEGVIVVAREEAPNKFGVAQTVRTERGARTMALDLRSHTLYTVTAQFGPPPPATKEHPHPYPAVISSTFTLLVYTQ
jgi:DNA-binding beta-propeller fold protein YncE